MSAAKSSALPVRSLVDALASQLLAKNLMLATAESCTGGGIAAALTDLAGSSAWFDAGFVTYSNSAKQRMLNVPAKFFAPSGPGAVSEEVVRAMAAGAVANSKAQLAVAVSGVAGPGGGSEDKPVGTVWIGWQWHDGQRAQLFHFPGDRAAVRLATISAGLQGLVHWLDE